jgi:hypothetical protein
MGVHYRDERKWVCVKVGVRVAISGILGEAETLEVSAVLGAIVETTVWPVVTS